MVDFWKRGAALDSAPCCSPNLKLLRTPVKITNISRTFGSVACASTLPVKQYAAPDENVVGRVRHCSDAFEMELLGFGVVCAVDLLTQRPLVLCEQTL